MSESNVSSLSKVFFPPADLERPLRGQNALVTGTSYGRQTTDRTCEGH